MGRSCEDSSCCRIKKRQTCAQVTTANFKSKCENNYRHNKCKRAYKRATRELHYNLRGQKAGKRGFGARSVAAKYNLEILNSPEDKKLRHFTIIQAVGRGEVGLSPPKMGRTPKIPEVFTKALAVHATMLQVSGDGEASQAKMLAACNSLTVGTDWEGKFSSQYAWRATRTRHPEYLMPVGAKNTDDRRMDWLSFQSINSWTDAVKKHLIEIGMLSDQSGYISECIVFAFFHYIPVLSILLFNIRRGVV